MTYNVNTNQSKDRVAIFTLEKLNFRAKIMSDKKIHIIMIIEYFPDEHITIQNMYAHIN